MRTIKKLQWELGLSQKGTIKAYKGKYFIAKSIFSLNFPPGVGACEIRPWQ